MTDSTLSGSGFGRGIGTHAITAMFDSRSAADAAVKSLLENGFAQDDVRLVPGYERDADGSATRTEDSGGFWSSLSEFFFPEEDRHTYAEGLSRGHFLVSVETTEANHARALDILDDEGTIDLDEQEDSWRTQGWTGYAGAPATGTASAAPAGLGAGSGMSRSSVAGSGMTGGSDGSRLGGAAADLGGGSMGMRDGMDASSSRGRTVGIDGDGLGLTRGTGANAAAADRGTAGGLDGGFVGSDRAGQSSSTAGAGLSGGGSVGTTDDERGRMRVRSYVVERPADEQRMLRREPYDVQRRAADRAIAAGEDPFGKRTDVEVDDQRMVDPKDQRQRS